MSYEHILLSYDEYERLKNVEKEFEKINTRNKSLSDNSSSESSLPHQTGAGADAGPSTSTIQLGSGSSEIIEKIADIVAKKILPTTTNWQNFNLEPPSIIQLGSPNTKPGLPFGIEAKKDDLNNSFDEKELLKLISTQHRKQAKVLLDQFNKRGHDLTWTTDGTILIDEVSIPDSNIFVLFPLLFKRSKSNLPGFSAFVQKITEMGLDHLIKARPLKQVKKSENQSESENWWYLG